MSVVGIDLGTTNTVVACVRSGKVHVLADEHGARLLPSVVSFHPNGEVLVGGSAKSRRIIDPKNTVYSHKRLIGRSWGSPEIAQAKSRFAFELKEGPGQGPLVRTRGQDYTLPEISAFVLKRARQIAETALGTPIERAVITVPAHFNELQRASTKVAGRVSGLEVLRILNEPTAAALAYGLGRTGNERVAVYDFGGGTFDCTLLDLNGNVFEVLATAGDSFLGGDDVDNLIAERMAETYLKAYRYDPRTDPQMLERLKTTAEDIKMVLSTAETHTVVLKEFGHGAQGAAINYTFTMTRRDLDHMITPLVDRSFKVTQDALSLARLTPTAFDKIILVGGSTRMPLVRKRVEAFFGQTPLDRVNPDEVVAIGAAIQAAALTEGARKRSIPAPPNVIGKPRTLPGIASDSNENTQTGAIDPAALQGKPPPAFASGPPSFGFHPASSPPPGGPATKSGPPASFATGARAAANTAQVGGPRKITSTGVAPNTQPMGARSAEAPTSPGIDDDPSMASFPDLAVPAPFEWFPSSGQPSSGETAVRSAPPGSERSFGGNTLTATGVDQSTLTSSGVPGDAVTLQPSARRSAAGSPSTTGSERFGAIDEPPSIMSMPDTSVPSFPSMTGGASSGVPSPIGEPDRFRLDARADSIPDGQFGAVRDLSLISSTGVSSQGQPSSSELGFGQLPDLSLVSTSSGTAEVDDVTQARARLLESIEHETERGSEAPVKGVPGALTAGKQKQPPTTTLSLKAAARSPAPLLGNDEAADLPSVAQPTDLPSLAGGRKRPELRKPGQPGMTAAGGPSMIGKPPPMLAPQPFGPMEKFGADGPPSRTAALQNRPSQPGQPAAPTPSPASSRNVLQGQALTGAQPARTGAMPARSGSGAPLNTTAPLNPPQQAFNQTAQLNPHQQPPPQPRPAPPFGTGLPTAAFGSVPPAQAFGGAPPPAGVPTAQMHPAGPAINPGMSPAYPSTPGLSPHGVPAPQRQAPAPQPPPQQYQAPPQQSSYGSAPPPPFASQPPNALQQPPPQPQGFGAYAPHDAPLDLNAMHQEYNPNTAVIPGGPGPQAQYQQQSNQQQSIGFAAPILVDVTPRGLVVETAGGYTDTIIPRNAKIPCERTRRFATGRDMQTTVRVRVGQGEHNLFPQNTFLGEVELAGLRPAPRGEVVVAVTFEVDADGTLRIRARDVQTGQEARATLQLVGVADESSVVMMINRFAQQPVVGEQTRGPH